MSDLYVTCPRCEGRRWVLAYTYLGNEFRPSRSEMFDCPLCHATGEADAEHAAKWTCLQAESPF
jgi:uncharacterized protein CbrC (UPF0167 family)